MQSLEEKLTTKWYRDYSHKLHIQRLEEIKSHTSKRIDNSAPKSQDAIPPQKQGKVFLQKEKKKLITKNNQQLLKVLTEITAGKRETVTQKILNSVREGPACKSLNIAVRKKEAKRIDEDNEELVRRLNDKKPGVSFKKLQEDWSVVNKYRESISKRGGRNGSSHFINRLPPMDSAGERSKNEGNYEEVMSKTLNAVDLPKVRKRLKKFSLRNTEIVVTDVNKSKEEVEEVNKVLMKGKNEKVKEEEENGGRIDEGTNHVEERADCKRSRECREEIRNEVIGSEEKKVQVKEKDEESGGFKSFSDQEEENENLKQSVVRGIDRVEDDMAGRFSEAKIETVTEILKNSLMEPEIFNIEYEVIVAPTIDIDLDSKRSSSPQSDSHPPSNQLYDTPVIQDSEAEPQIPKISENPSNIPAQERKSSPPNPQTPPNLSSHNSNPKTPPNDFEIPDDLPIP